MTTEQMKDCIEAGEAALLHTYNRYQIVLERGEGVYLYDVRGKRYLDFASGIGVFALGYGNQAYNEALKDQIDKLIHTSNYYYNLPAIRAAGKLKEVSGMEKVFFTNSGAEAVEGAIKAARKYARNRDGHSDHEMIAMEHSFHGRTLGALAVTGTPAYREAFEPLGGTVRFARFNDIDSVRELVNDKTCAVILEPVQGEGGVYPAEPEFLKAVESLCRERDILLILDEIQCGMGRCGTMYACEGYGVKPDILTTAKALGCGVPVGAFLLNARVAASSLTAGDHGSTYGGNPLAGAAVDKVLDLFREKELLQHVNRLAAYLEERLDRLAAGHAAILQRRGRGLLQGLAFDRSVAPVVNLALEKGLILIHAGANVIRFIPPLIIEEAHVDEMCDILKECLEEAGI